MRIDYARGCFSDNELEAAYVLREWRRTTSTFAVTIVILIAALTVLASLCESDSTWYLPFVSTRHESLARLRLLTRKMSIQARTKGGRAHGGWMQASGTSGRGAPT